MRYAFAVLLCLATPLGAEPLRVLAIGDSILAWHKWTGRDIPSVMGAVLGAQVENDAVAGALFSNTSGLGRAVGFDVRAQFRPGPWDLVLINGGANDFLADCGCRACDSVLDGLIAPDLSGEVATLLAEVLASGAEVIWMGYYASARSGQFAGCRPYLVEYDARLARLAAQTLGLSFVDSEAVLDREDRGHFAFDGIHPSPEGARRIGAYLARSVKQ
ncbi:MAG: SGNH/GDSL hydrolase family protein [Tateyamaria sp.]|uniref:SGNH/GDSL hydrolase family protein n=1 Tax=Tateyamaria sp. TaxID=1929288 RepID=UPI00329D4893